MANLVYLRILCLIDPSDVPWTVCWRIFRETIKYKSKWKKRVFGHKCLRLEVFSIHIYTIKSSIILISKTAN